MKRQGYKWYDTLEATLRCGVEKKNSRDPKNQSDCCIVLYQCLWKSISINYPVIFLKCFVLLSVSSGGGVWKVPLCLLPVNNLILLLPLVWLYYFLFNINNHLLLRYAGILLVPMFIFISLFMESFIFNFINRTAEMLH